MTKEVIVKMEPGTISALMRGGYRLYGFRAIRTENHAALPVLWLATKEYLVYTKVALVDHYCAYISNSRLQSGQRIFMGFTASIKLGQCLKVDQTGTGQVKQGRTGFISIANASSTAFVAGLGIQDDMQAAESTPFFAEPLYGIQTDFFQPTSKILLVLSTDALIPGTVVDALPLVPESKTSVAALTAGILIDAAASRTVNFDINQGWSWGETNWARLVDVSTDLTSALIEPLKS